MALVSWSKLPVMVRRSRRKLYEYVRENVGSGEGGSSEPHTHELVDVTDLTSVEAVITYTDDSTETVNLVVLDAPEEP